MLISLHWLPIKQCIEYKLATLAFRYFDGTSPPYLSHCLSSYTPHRSLRSSSHKLLCVPRVNLKSASVCPNTNPIFYIFQIQPQNAPLPQCLHLSLWNCHPIHGLVGGGVGGGGLHLSHGLGGGTGAAKHGTNRRACRCCHFFICWACVLCVSYCMCVFSVSVVYVSVCECVRVHVCLWGGECAGVCV